MKGKQIPLGQDFLKHVRNMENQCEVTFDEWVYTAEGKQLQIEALGTAVSYIDQISSCMWGCREGDHVIEYIIGRAGSNGMAAFRLLRTGYYDEALGIIRQIGETANLLFLFMKSSEYYVE